MFRAIGQAKNIGRHYTNRFLYVRVGRCSGKFNASRACQRFFTEFFERAGVNNACLEHLALLIDLKQ